MKPSRSPTVQLAWSVSRQSSRSDADAAVLRVDHVGPTDLDLGAISVSPEWRFVRGDREVRVACTPRFATNSADAAIQYAEHDGGADAIKGGRLRIVLAKFEQPALPIHIVYPTSRLLSSKVRTFIDLVADISDWHFG